MYMKLLLKLIVAFTISSIIMGVVAIMYMSSPTEDVSGDITGNISLQRSKDIAKYASEEVIAKGHRMNIQYDFNDGMACFTYSDDHYGVFIFEYDESNFTMVGFDEVLKESSDNLFYSESSGELGKYISVIALDEVLINVMTSVNYEVEQDGKINKYNMTNVSKGFVFKRVAKDAELKSLELMDDEKILETIVIK